MNLMNNSCFFNDLEMLIYEAGFVKKDTATVDEAFVLLMCGNGQLKTVN